MVGTKKVENHWSSWTRDCVFQEFNPFSIPWKIDGFLRISSAYGQLDFLFCNWSTPLWEICFHFDINQSGHESLCQKATKNTEILKSGAKFWERPQIYECVPRRRRKVRTWLPQLSYTSAKRQNQLKQDSTSIGRKRQPRWTYCRKKCTKRSLQLL